MFSISVFDRGIVSVLYFESLFGGPDIFILSARFSFSNKGNISFFYIIFVWLVFAVCCF